MSKVIENYFENLRESLKDAFPENLLNYDETNITAGPTSKRLTVDLSLKCLKQSLQQNEKLHIRLPGY